MDKAIKWPVKTREMHNHTMDSTIWNDFKFRDDDIVIVTYGKTGTTWMQQIISQMLFNGQEDMPVADMSPWLDFRLPNKEIKLPMVEAQEHRRFVKTHLPIDALVYSPKAKYIYIGRDVRDIAWSMFNFHYYSKDMMYDAINNEPGRQGPPLPKPIDDVVKYYQEMVWWNGYPWWEMWGSIKGWWDIRDLPNLMFVHFQNLKDDMEGNMRKIGKFLEIDYDEAKWPEIVEHCTFDYMKAHATPSVPMGGIFWEGGAETFIHKGTNGRWKDLLSQQDIDHYEKTIVEKLGEDCAHWIMTGDFKPGDPGIK